MLIHTSTVFLSGTLLGTLMMMGVFVASHRRRRHRHHKDPIYAAARYAAHTHLKRYGNLTNAVLKDALDIPDITAERYMRMLERDGIVLKHSHGVKTFYTRA